MSRSPKEIEEKFLNRQVESRAGSYFIVPIENVDGDETKITLEVETKSGDWVQVNTFYAVIGVYGDHAEILDNCFRSVEEAKKAWPDAKEKK